MKPRQIVRSLSFCLLAAVLLLMVHMLSRNRTNGVSRRIGEESEMKRQPPPMVYPPPQRIHRSDVGLPERIQKALSVVDNLPGMIPLYEEHGIDIEETETSIIITWPSRYEGTNARRADYEMRAVVDKQTFSVISLMRGS